MENRPKHRKWHTRRDEIVDGAASLFAQRGYDATGVAELGDQVGLGRGALYYYIESKEKLLSLIHDRVMTEVLAAADEIVAKNLPAKTSLEQFGLELVRITTTYPDHVWVFLHEYRALTGDNLATFHESRRNIESFVASIIERGVAEGDFFVDDSRLATFAWLGMHNYVYIWYRAGGRYTAEQIGREFGRIFLTGLSGFPPGDLTPANQDSYPSTLGR